MLLSTVGYRSTIVITTATMAMITVIRGCGFQLPPRAQPRVMMTYQVREGSTYGRWGIPGIGQSFGHPFSMGFCLLILFVFVVLLPLPSSSTILTIFLSSHLNLS